MRVFTTNGTLISVDACPAWNERPDLSHFYVQTMAHLMKEQQALAKKQWDLDLHPVPSFPKGAKHDFIFLHELISGPHPPTGLSR